MKDVAEFARYTMQKNVAAAIIDMMQKHMHELNESVRHVQENCGPEELRSYRRGIGYILSEMGDRIMDPIYREHPDLLPKNIDYAPRPGPTLAKL